MTQQSKGQVWQVCYLDMMPCGAQQCFKRLELKKKKS